MRLFIEQQDATARPLALEQPGQPFFGAVASRNAVGIGVVVVNADDVGGDTFPAVIADHRPGRVERFRQVIQRLHPMPLRRAVRQIRHAPGFVERNPGNDARMAGIALDDLHPLARSSVRRTRV